MFNRNNNLFGLNTRMFGPSFGDLDGLVPFDPDQLPNSIEEEIEQEEAEREDNWEEEDDE